MAESNAPEHKDRGLFGLFGKKKEDETPQQFPTNTNPADSHGYGFAGQVPHAPTPPQHHPASTTPAYPQQAYGHSGEVQHAAPADSHGYGQAGQIPHTTPPAQHHPAPTTPAYPHQPYGQKVQPPSYDEEPVYNDEGGKKLHRNNSSSSASSSDEEDGGRKKEGGRKKKGMRERLPGPKQGQAQQGYGENEGEKKGMVSKIKEKLPGHKTEQEKMQY